MPTLGFNADHQCPLLADTKCPSHLHQVPLLFFTGQRLCLHTMDLLEYGESSLANSLRQDQETSEKHLDLFHDLAHIEHAT